MSKRLQVLLDEEELEEIRAVVRRKRMTVAEWVRQSPAAAPTPVSSRHRTRQRRASPRT